MKIKKMMISILSLFLLSSICFGEERAEFKFSPGDNTVVIERVNALREQNLGELGIQTNESAAKTRVVYKKVDKGWNITATPLEIKMKRNGEPLVNPVFDILKTNPITYELSNSGHLVDVSGYDEISNEIFNKFDKDTAVKVSSIFSKEGMKKKAFAEWDKKAGSYIGKSVKEGDKWEKDEEFILPNKDKIKYRVTTEFFLNQKYKDKNCVKIKIKYLNTGLKDKKEGASISGSAQLLIDPATMNIYSQNLFREIEMKMEMGEKGEVPVKLLEKRTYTYQYR